MTQYLTKSTRALMADPERKAKFDQAVDEGMIDIEVRNLRVKHAARARFAAEHQPPAKPYDIATLGEMLERPDDPPGRVTDLIPWDASTLLVAQHKTGKTTFALNLSRSLLTGEPFLGEFSVVPVDGTVALLNFEVSGKTVARWADKVGVPRDRLIIVNLRGAANPFADPERLASLGKALRAKDVETVIVDPFGRAYTGDNQNDNGPVGMWLTALDAWARNDVGARDVVLAAHAGHDGERVRGASALADWPDSIISLTKDEQGVRYMSAIGRDVLVEEDALSFEPDTHLLSTSGDGSRNANRARRERDSLAEEVVAIALERPGISTGDIEAALDDRGVSRRKGDASKALALAVNRGEIRRERDGQFRRYYPPYAPPHTPRVPPAEETPE